MDGSDGVSNSVVRMADSHRDLQRDVGVEEGGLGDRCDGTVNQVTDASFGGQGQEEESESHLEASRVEILAGEESNVSPTIAPLGGQLPPGQPRGSGGTVAMTEFVLHKCCPAAARSRSHSPPCSAACSERLPSQATREVPPCTHKQLESEGEARISSRGLAVDGGSGSDIGIGSDDEKERGHQGQGSLMLNTILPVSGPSCHKALDELQEARQRDEDGVKDAYDGGNKTKTGRGHTNGKFRNRGDSGTCSNLAGFKVNA